MLFTLSSQSLGTVANGEVVAGEIVATLVGSIGLVAAVPVSTALAVLVTSDHEPAATPRPRARRHHTTTPAETAEAVTPEPATAGGSDLLAPVERDFWT